MLDDFRDFFRYMSKGVFRSNSRKAELTQQMLDVNLQIKSRKTAFSILVLGSILLPLYIYVTFDVFYPSLKNSWDWAYWRWFMLFSIGVYILAVILTPRIRRARTVYVLRALYLFPFYLFCIGMGQVISFLIIPKELIFWYLLFFLPVFVYSPSMFRKKWDHLKAAINSNNIRWKLKKEPVWYYREYLPENGSYPGGCWGILLPILITLFLYFLVDIHLFFGYDAGNIIRLGIANAAILYYFVVATYHTILVAYLLTELEQEIFQPILLEEL